MQQKEKHSTLGITIMYEAPLKKKTNQKQNPKRSSPATAYYRALTEIPAPVGTSMWIKKQWLEFRFKLVTKCVTQYIKH